MWTALKWHFVVFSSSRDRLIWFFQRLISILLTKRLHLMCFFFHSSIARVVGLSLNLLANEFYLLNSPTCIDLFMSLDSEGAKMCRLLFYHVNYEAHTNCIWWKHKLLFSALQTGPNPISSKALSPWNCFMLPSHTHMRHTHAQTKRA